MASLFFEREEVSHGLVPDLQSPGPQVKMTCMTCDCVSVQQLEKFVLPILIFSMHIPIICAWTPLSMLIHQ